MKRQQLEHLIRAAAYIVEDERRPDKTYRSAPGR